MKLIGFDKNGVTYSVTFEDVLNEDTVITQVSFEERWSLVDRNSDENEEYRTRAAFHIKEAFVKYPYEVKENLECLPIHIPEASGRYILKACLDIFIKTSLAPMQITAESHPGYPIMVITFNASIIPRENVLQVIDNIISSIENSTVIYKENEKRDPVLAEEDEVADDAPVIEFEEDEEVKSLMKEPTRAEDEFEPFEGG